MSEVVASGQTTVSPAAPVATPVASAPVSAPSQSAAEAPASSAAPAVQESAAPAVDAQASGMLEPKKAPEYDWSKWEGDSEALPEEWRDPVKNASKYFQQKYADYDDYVTKVEDAQAKIQELENLYNTAIEGYGQDPRFDELNGKYEHTTKELQQIKSEYQAFQQEVEAWNQKEAQDYAQNLAKSYPKYFTDDAHKAKLSNLLKEDWDPEVAIKVLELGDAAVEAARNVRAEGGSDSLALKFAELSASSKPKPQKREAAQVMAGAEPTSAPVSAKMSLKDANSREERIRMAAERAIRLHQTRG